MIQEACWAEVIVRQRVCAPHLPDFQAFVGLGVSNVGFRESVCLLNRARPTVRRHP